VGLIGFYKQTEKLPCGLSDGVYSDFGEVYIVFSSCRGWTYVK